MLRSQLTGRWLCPSRLWKSRPGFVQLQVESVSDSFRSWGENSNGKFVFRIKLFTDSLRRSSDPAIIHLMYIQVRATDFSLPTPRPTDVRFHLALQTVHAVITGLYPCDEQAALQLAALQFQCMFGKHNPSRFSDSIQERCRMLTRLSQCVLHAVTPLAFWAIDW